MSAWVIFGSRHPGKLTPQSLSYNAVRSIRTPIKASPEWLVKCSSLSQNAKTTGFIFTSQVHNPGRVANILPI
jgi:hypothetical protein